VQAAQEVVVGLQGPDTHSDLRLRIATLPRSADGGSPALWSPAATATSLDAVCPIEVLEGQEYRYEWMGLDPTLGCVQVDPEELFQPDAVDGRTGRLRPGLSTGVVPVVLRSDEQVLGRLEIEVRSRKLTYRSEYRWMLRDIAERMTELVMDRFAASEARFAADEARDAETLYQRFAFLRALLDSEAFQVALAEVLRRPHTAWEVRGEWVRPGAGLRADSSVLRQLSRAGARTAWEVGPISSLPAFMERRQTHATHDTPPNRFVKFALEHWRQVLGDIDHGLSLAEPSPATIRGRRELMLAIGQIEESLHNDLFSTLGPLTRFPADDQVLQKRAGYRDIFKAYVEFELAARLSWNRTSDSYGAGQRDVATLYEYWAFIQLAELVAGLVGKSFDMCPLLRVQGSGLNVVLRSGVETVLRGEVERHGRRMDVELCFNRTYGAGGAHAGSWTRPMRPDYSLHIKQAAGELVSFEPVVLHFDAKYRVDFVEELFGFADELGNADVDDAASEGTLRRGGVMRSDLLKMHAYRDAIRRTAGAYVLYPGGDAEIDRQPFTEYHELLPGLGAFVLRPTELGTASGTMALQRFLDDVLDHVATRLTDHERGRYWLGEVYGRPGTSLNGAGLDVPPPETSVLLGYVKSREHWSWIMQRKTYNVRAEGRTGGVSSDAALLQSQLLLLYCPELEQLGLARIVSDAQLVSRDNMKVTKYPRPNGDYWCVQVSFIARSDWVADLSASRVALHVEQLGLARGAPVRLSWGSLRAMLSERDASKRK
jgi:uncharacterized protein